MSRRGLRGFAAEVVVIWELYDSRTDRDFASTTVLDFFPPLKSGFVVD
jgi:hypothetical protein